MVQIVQEWCAAIDMFKLHESLLCVCYSTKKSDFGTVVGLENMLNE